MMAMATIPSIIVMYLLKMLKLISISTADLVSHAYLLKMDSLLKLKKLYDWFKDKFI